MSFPRYPKYKDSGVEWLGEVPEEWEIQPIKTVASCNDDVLGESTDEDYELEYVEISDVDVNRGITGSTLYTFKEAPSRARRQVKDGDVLVSTVRTYLRAIAPVHNPPENLTVSTGFAVIRPQSVLSGFIGYFFLSEYLMAEVISRSVGVSYPAINASQLMQLVAALPPQTEQQAIAAFLDRETAKIDALVAEQENLIGLLKEKRQAVISHAVTKGLDLTVPMKDSGIEWLGEVPEKWSAISIKRVTSTITDGAHVSPDTDNGVYDFVSTKDITDDGIDFYGCLKTSPASYDYLIRTGCKPHKGDVLFSKDGTIGRTVVVKTNHNFVVASSLIIIRPDVKALSSYFLSYLCLSFVVTMQVDKFVKGAGLPRLSIQNLLKIILVIPPVDEQQTIVEYLDTETAKLDDLTTEARHTIDLLKERRSALISAAVTGKIDVRGYHVHSQPTT